MKLNYFIHDQSDKVGQIQVLQACPGCGGIKTLAIHSERISYLKNKIRYWIGCSCGWRGPALKDPDQAAAAWDLRD